MTMMKTAMMTWVAQAMIIVTRLTTGRAIETVNLVMLEISDSRYRYTSYNYDK